MRILALDTAMAACSVAVSDGDVVIASAFEPMERGHAEALAPMVERMVREAGLQFGDLDRIIVTIGPGTFTGVRIGLAMARGLGLALGIPVIGIDTLTAIACNQFNESSPRRRPGSMESLDSGLRRSDGIGKGILIATDARKGEVYAALLGGGQLIGPPHIVAVDQAARGVPMGTIVMGTAAQAVTAASGRSDFILSSAGNLPVAANFAARAAQLPAPRAMPAPIYLRAPDAKPQTTPLRKAKPDIVAASVQSADLLANLHAECFDTAWHAQTFSDLLAMPGATAAIAMEHQEPLGFALVRRAVDEAEIITIATRPMAQRRGVARALLDHQFTELIGLGVARVFIEVAQSNAAARALYASLGFTQAGLRRGYYERVDGRHEDAIVMRKDLKA